jgi:hypothetical protein
VPHFDAVTADPTWRARYVDGLAAARAAMDPAVLDGRAERWAAQLRDAVAEDPNLTFTLEEHEDAVASLRAFVPARAAHLDEWLACDAAPDASEHDGDGDGAPWCGECDDADPEVAPGAPEQCNFADDDCDAHVDETDACCSETAIGEASFGLCNAPRTFAEAEAFCAEQGGALAVPDDVTRQSLVTIAYWLAFEDWWISDEEGACVVMEAFFGGTPDARPCDERHPAVCALP